MSHHLVVASGLSFRYPDGLQALHDITFTIHHGEAVGVIGGNGAGKSTLLLHLVGCLFSTTGEVRIGETPVSPRTLEAVRRSVGMVFQNPDDQLFTPTVGEDVAFGPRNQGLPEAEVEARVRQALAAVGISSLAERPPFHLSGGEKRAASIATVLSMAPDLLILDEPSAGLDPGARRHLINLLRAFDHTRIIASHDLDLILDICDRVLLLRQGVILADGPAHDILSNGPLLASAGLELPFRLQGCPKCGA